MRGGGPECAHAVSRNRKMAQVADGRGCHAPSTRVLGNPVPENGGARRPEDQVESAQHRRVALDEQVVRAEARLLLGHPLAVSFGEVLEVRIATVGDHRREARSISQLERQHRRFVVSSKKLQVRHRLTLSVGPKRYFAVPHTGMSGRI